jgi:hypothetical protein
MAQLSNYPTQTTEADHLANCQCKLKIVHMLRLKNKFLAVSNVMKIMLKDFWCLNSISKELLIEIESSKL